LQALLNADALMAITRQFLYFSACGRSRFSIEHFAIKSYSQLYWYVINQYDRCHDCASRSEDVVTFELHKHLFW